MNLNNIFICKIVSNTKLVNTEQEQNGSLNSIETRTLGDNVYLQ